MGILLGFRVKDSLISNTPCNALYILGDIFEITWRGVVEYWPEIISRCY